jgi:hypothetical protein
LGCFTIYHRGAKPGVMGNSLYAAGIGARRTPYPFDMRMITGETDIMSISKAMADLHITLHESQAKGKRK